MTKTKIINLYGGPGTGKSTSAAYLYYVLKDRGYNAELVREYVKDWAWEGRKPDTYDQLYLFGKQVRREKICYGKTDVIVTDSPVLLGLVYSNLFSTPELHTGLLAANKAFYNQAKKDGHEHVHVFLKRSKPYNPQGRYQTEEQAKEIDLHVGRLLEEMGVSGISCGTDKAELESLLDKILRG